MGYTASVNGKARHTGVERRSNVPQRSLLRRAVPLLAPFVVGIGALGWLIYHLSYQHPNPLDLALVAVVAVAMLAIGAIYLRQAQQVVDQQNRLAARLERERELGNLKTRFVSMISHEIRTPLTTIYAASDLLKLYGSQMSDAERMVEIEAIQSEVRAITGLMDDVLTVDDGAGRAPRLKFETVDLAAVAQEIWNRCRVVLQAKHRLDLVVAPGSERAVVESTRFRQILDNLLSNAMKYSPDADSVRLELGRKDGNLTIKVIDHGMGIPPEDRQRVFEAFHRGGNVEAISGSGLGLAVVQRAAAQLGGSVELRSEIGRGTEVEVRLAEGPARREQGVPA